MTHESRSISSEALLAYLRRPEYDPVPQRTLMHRLHIGPGGRPELRRLIDDLLQQGKIVKLSRGRLAVAPTLSAQSGTLQLHRDGYGFVSPDAGGPDVYIPRRNVGSARSGDRVTIRLSSRGRTGRTEGLVVRTLERPRREVLGLFVGGRRGGTVQPFDPTVTEAIRIPAAFQKGASQNQAVRVEVVDPAGPGGPATGKVLELLGDMDQSGTDVQVLAQKYGLRTKFPDEVLEAADQLPSRIGPRATSDRTRFDDPAPVTIDGETARDFDDAIAVVERPGGGFRLWVHIADVAHFVPVGSELDLEARRRGNSVYFPHRVLPMFPEKLSNDLCSLRPGVDRLVQSVILDIDASGEVTRVRCSDGVIRSAARLTYTQVAEVLENGERVPGVPSKIVPMLKSADRLRVLFERRRQERGSVDFDLPEPQILLDVEGVMTGITIEPRNAAHRLIEECMLAANEAVARELDRRGRACMYRVHDQPDPVKLQALESFVRGFGVPTPERSATLHPGYIRELLAPFEDTPDSALVSQVALRSMKRACYAMENSGHFGLAAPTYCHFTSPIRRYPDLVVHRLLRSARTRRSGAESWERELDDVAASCSELERSAEGAERELLQWKKVAFIADHVGDGFKGVVTGVTSFGLFVQLTENLVEGLVRIDRLGDERFELAASGFELHGQRTRRRFRLGDRLDVRVERVDRVLQRVDFCLEQALPEPALPGVAGRGARSGRRQEYRRGRPAGRAGKRRGKR